MALMSIGGVWPHDARALACMLLVPLTVLHDRACEDVAHVVVDLTGDARAFVEPGLPHVGGTLRLDIGDARMRQAQPFTPCIGERTVAHLRAQAIGTQSTRVFR